MIYKNGIGIVLWDIGAYCVHIYYLVVLFKTLYRLKCNEKGLTDSILLFLGSKNLFPTLLLLKIYSYPILSFIKNLDLRNGNIMGKSKENYRQLDIYT